MKKKLFHRIVASVIILTILLTNLQVFADYNTDQTEETIAETEGGNESENESEEEQSQSKIEETDSDIPDLPEESEIQTEEEDLLDADSVIMATAATANIEHVGYVTYGASTVGEFKVNGTSAFCFEHAKESPYSGISNSGLTPYNNENIAKTLYFGWGGSGNIFTNKSEGWVGTSLLLSHYYSGTSSANAAYTKLKNKVESSSAVPDPTASFSRTSATSSINNGVQRSQTIKLNADSSNRFTISLPSSVTLYNTTTGASKTGGSVTIKGGDSFYLTAPLSYNTNYNSGNLKGTMKKFQPYVVKTNSSYYQDVGFGVFEDSTQTISFSVTFTARTGDLTISKKSSTGALLSGATFQVKNSSNSVVSTVTTGTNGTAKVNSLYIGQRYTITETKAPAGFKIDTSSKNVTMASSSSVEFTNTPYSGVIELQKSDSVTKEFLDGAEFSIQEYNGSSYVNSSYKFTYNSDKDKYISSKLTATLKNQGKFRIIETKNPGGYFGSYSKDITLSAVNQTINLTAENKPYSGKIELIKKDSKTGELLERATFTILEWDKYKKDFIESDYQFVYDKSKEKYISDGLTTTNANEGKFKVCEVKVPGGYYDEMWESGVIILAAEQETILIDVSNTYVPGQVILTKKDNRTDEILSRTKFKIYEWSLAADEYLDNNKYSFYFDDRLGHYVSDLLTPTNDNDGKFLITEDAAQPGYTGSFEHYISIPSDQEFYEYEETVTNTPFNGTIRIQKLDSNSGTDLDRTKFEIYEYSVKQDKYVLTNYLMEYDRIAKQYISPELFPTNDNDGKYKVKEVQPQSGFYGEWEQDFSLTKINQEFSYKVENHPYYGKIEIDKRDKRTKEVLERASFDLWEWSYESNNYLLSDHKIIYNPVTQKYESGLIYATNDNEGRFFITESTSPDGYTGSWQSEKIQLSEENQQLYYDVENESFYGYIDITKLDSLTEEILERAEFTLYEWSCEKGDFIESDYEILYNPASKKYESGPLYSSNDNLGRFKIIETIVPDGYAGQWDSGIFHLLDMNDSFSYTVKNKALTATIEIEKKDSKTNNLLSGAKFLIQEWSYLKGAYVDTSYQFTVDNTSRKYISDILTSTNDNGGRYQVIETDPPTYYVGEWTSQVLPVSRDEQLFELSVTNDPIYLTINAVKVDRTSLRHESRGGASLEGAEYGLYANEAFVHPNGKRFAKDQLIATTLTDSRGCFSFNELYPAYYYLQEISPSEGYLLDDTKYPIDGHQENTTSLEIVREVDVFEQIKSQAFQIVKVHSDGSSNETELLEGIQFKIYPIETLSEVVAGNILPDANGKFNASDFINYNFDGEMSAVDVNSEIVQDLVTDKKGYAVSQRLVYGQYIVVEDSEGLGGLFIPLKPFIVDITEDNDVPQEWRILNNDKFNVHIKIVKKDSQTNETILKPGAKYRIYDLNNNKFIEQWSTFPESILYGTEENPYVTTANGVITLPNSLTGGDYRLIEVGAPSGYILQGWEAYTKDIYEGNDQKNPQINGSEPIYFSITPDVPIQIEPGSEINIIQVEQKNISAYGKLNLYKFGEFANHFATYGTFAYTDAAIKDAQFGVYSAEDIYTQDNQGTILYPKDTKVETITTDEFGQAWTNVPLPLGQYYVVEEIAGHGFLLDTKKWHFEITYNNEETAIIYHDISIENARQTIEIEVIKRDLETEKLLEGATIGLYSAENITGLNGRILAKPDTLITTATTDGSGKAIFNIDLPHGQYYCVELEAPSGYILSDQKFFFDCSYSDQNKEKIIHSATFKNKITELTVVKRDLNTNKTIYNAEFELYNTDLSGKAIGDPLYTWTSTAGEPYIMKGLTVGETYLIRETAAPYGYIVSEDTLYTIQDTGELQSVTIYDDIAKGTFAISKKGEFLASAQKPTIGENILSSFKYFFKYISGNLENVEFEVYAAELIIHPDGNSADFYSAGDYVGTIKTGVDGIARFTEKLESLPSYFDVGQLPLGSYFIKEVTPGENHIINTYIDTVKLEYQDCFTPLVYGNSSYKNDRQKVFIELQKIDSETDDAIEGALFSLTADEDIYSTITDPEGNTAAGELIVPAGTIIAQSFSDQNGYVKFDLDIPHGSYSIKEVQQPAGYILGTQEIKIDATYDPDNLTPLLEYKHVYPNIPTEVVIRKESIDGTPLEGAMLGIFDADDTLIHSWSTDQNGELIYKYLAAEHLYVLKEILPAAGYVTAAPIYFMISSSGQLQVWEGNEYKTRDRLIMQDENTKVEIHKVDSVTGENLSDASLQILDMEETICYEITTTDTPELIKGIPIGTYVLREISAPDNYLKANDIVFSVQDTPDIQSIIMEDTPIKGRLSISKEGEFLESATETKKDSLKDLLTHTFKYIMGRAAGVSFSIYAAENIPVPGTDQLYFKANEHITDVTTAKDGIARINKKIESLPDFYELGELPLGQYYVVETHPGMNGHALNSFIGSLSLQAEDEYTPVVYATSHYINDRQKIAITGQKISAESKDALPDAVFSLITEENIYAGYIDEYAGNRPLILPAGSVVEQAVSDESGRILFTADIPNGKYFIQETSQPPGYLLSDKKYAVDATYDPNNAVDLLSFTFENANVGTEIEVKKIDENGKYLPAAKLAIYNASGDMIYSWTSGDSSVWIPSLACDEIYILRELDPAPGYTTAADISFKINNDGTILYNKDNSWHKTESICMTDYPTELQITKKDSITGENLPGAHLQIQDSEGNTVHDFVSTDTPENITGLPIGSYSLVEISSPAGYLLSAPVDFTIVDTSDLHTVEMSNQAVKGKIIVTKEGELLNNVTRDDSIFNRIKTIFHYIFGPVEDVSFVIHAAEDITHPFFSDLAYFEKGEVVAEITTDKSGTATISEKLDALPAWYDIGELPLGTYTVSEVIAGDGYVLNKYIDTIVLAEDNTEIVYGESVFHNERQKISISMYKEDNDTKLPIPDTIFALYSTEDIYSSGVSDEVNILLPANTLIEHFVTGHNGIGMIEADLPCGKYEIREYKPANGFISGDEVFALDTTYNPELQELESIEYSYTMKNKRTEIEVMKMANDSLLPLPNAKLGIYTADTNELITEWISGTDAQIINYLQTNVEYILCEIQAPDGYTLADDILFKLSDDHGQLYIFINDEWQMQEGNKITMLDNAQGFIEIQKLAYGSEKPLSNATFSITSEDELYEVLKSDTEGIATLELPLGEYVLKEISAPEGYIRNEDTVSFRISTAGETVKIIFYNKALHLPGNEKPPIKTDDYLQPLLYVSLIIVTFGIFVRLKRSKRRVKA